jgi:hypothetical protein
MLVHDEQPPECKQHLDLFFAPVDDGRIEEGRVEREAAAATICFSCPYRIKCLDHALVTREPYGVWGGMGEGERRKFVDHLRTEGYARHEVPPGLELIAALNAFYRTNPRMIPATRELAEAS